MSRGAAFAMGDMRLVAAIPARLESQRLPRKPLYPIFGRPLLWHTWIRVQQAKVFDSVVVVTDSEEIASEAKGWPANVVMSSRSCCSGTERLASVLTEIGGDVIVNVQGDEALIDPVALQSVAHSWKRGMQILTPVFAITSMEMLSNPHVVKVARASDGRALYFSRAPIPFLRDATTSEVHLQEKWAHVGVYCYSKETLASYPGLAVSTLEQIEMLEQLRWLDAGYRIDTCEITAHLPGIDTIDDVRRVEAFLGSDLPTGY